MRRLIVYEFMGLDGVDRYADACMRRDGTRLGVVPRVRPMSWGLLGSQ